MTVEKWIVGSAVWQETDNLNAQCAVADLDMLWTGITVEEMDADSDFERIHTQMPIYKMKNYGQAEIALADAYLPAEEAVMQDLARREFNVSAAARRVTDGTILDPYNGADVAAGLAPLDIVGDDVFERDPVRIIRAIRKCIQYKVPPTDRLIKAADAAADALANVSNERTYKEICKLFEHIHTYGISDAVVVCIWPLLDAVIGGGPSVVSWIKQFIEICECSKELELPLIAGLSLGRAGIDVVRTRTSIPAVVLSAATIVTATDELSFKLSRNFRNNSDQIHAVVTLLLRAVRSWPQFNWYGLIYASGDSRLLLQRTVVNATKEIVALNMSDALAGVDIKYVPQFVRNAHKEIILGALLNAIY